MKPRIRNVIAAALVGSTMALVVGVQPANAAPIRISPQLVDDAARILGGQPRPLDLTTDVAAQLARQAEVSVATTERQAPSVTTNPAVWRAVESLVHHEFDRKAAMRSAVVETACGVVKYNVGAGEEAKASDLRKNFYKAVLTQPTLIEAVEMGKATNELIADLKKAKNSSNENERVSVLLTCYVAEQLA